MSQDPYESYERELIEAIRSDKPVSVSNQTRAHNAKITKQILNEGGYVRMYCGKMSVFRKSFYSHISRTEGDEIAENLENEVRESLRTFLTDPVNRLEIILANYHRLSDIRDLIDENIFREALDKKQVMIRIADHRKVMIESQSHITLSVNRRMARIEFYHNRKKKTDKAQAVDMESDNNHSAIFFTDIDDTRMDKLSHSLNVISAASSEIEY